MDELSDESKKYQSAAVIFAILFGFAALDDWNTHQHLKYVCRWTGAHEPIYGDDVTTPREGIDSICTGMPPNDEQPERN